MFAPIRAKLAAIWARAARLIDDAFRLRASRLAATLALACGLGGCLPATAPLSGADPADPAVRVSATGYRPAIAPYTSLRPSEPGLWLEQNRRVAPAPKSGQ